MVVVRLLRHGVVARIDGGDIDGDVHFIPRIDCTSNEGDITKSQGQTLYTVGVDLRSSIHLRPTVCCIVTGD